MTLLEHRMNLLQALCDAVTVWRNAHCVYGSSCQGENHLDDCPVELATQDLIDAHDKLLTLNPTRIVV